MSLPTNSVHPKHRVKWCSTLLFNALIILGLSTQTISAAPTDTELNLMALTINSITGRHYAPTPLDDTLSQRIFKQFIEFIDPNKQFLIAADINALSTHKNTIDNQILSEKTEFFEDTLQRIKNRTTFINSHYEQLLSQPFDYTIKTTIETDPDKKTVPANEQELLDRWKETLKYYTLNNAINLIEEKVGSNNALSAEEAQAYLTPEIERKARNKTKSSIARQIKHRQEKTRMDYFYNYINAVAQSEDPHTSYFPPEDKENFDIGMTGRLEGIGALLSEEDGNIKVSRIIPGSAAWRQKELQAEDIILKVTQKNTSKTVDLNEMSVQKAVKYIRGKKGSTVILTTKKPDGQIIDIAIVRDVVVIEDSYAKAAIIQPQNSERKFGYIYLPSFYRDFSNSNARNSSDDIRNYLHALSGENIQGVIIDLRNNGGGSLQDAVEISGHFIKTGPIVQVQDHQERRNAIDDRNPEIAYDGPVVVLINTFSASASEILAAALQDYRRAVIMGTETSYGKGTVQTFINFDDNLPNGFKPSKSMGSIKITVQQFYRINGSSTQFKGVHSDIIIPSTSDYLDIGESKMPNALKWDQINSLQFSAWNTQPNYSYLKKRSLERIKTHPGFKAISAYTTQLKTLNKLSQPMDFIESWERKQTVKKMSKSLEHLGSVALHNATVTPIYTQDTKLKEVDLERSKEWVDTIHKDIGIEEALAVISDMIGAPYAKWSQNTKKTTP
jgi:carboxyl-terminal processing protease